MIIKSKNEDLKKENDSLYNKIILLEDKLSKRIDDEIQREKKINEMIKELEENEITNEEIKDKLSNLKNKNILNDNNSIFSREKSINKKEEILDSINYIKIILKKFKPSNNRELEAANRLKHLIDDSNTSFKSNDDDFELNLDI